jgi:hypothetical protein
MGLAPAGEIHRGVAVAVHAMSAGAGEHAVSQGEVVADVAALAAELAGWIPAVGDDHLAIAPGLFVVQQPGVFCPPGIRDRPGEAMVGQHPRDVQIFDDEPVVGLDQRIGDLMQEMPPDAGDRPDPSPPHRRCPRRPRSPCPASGRSACMRYRPAARMAGDAALPAGNAGANTSTPPRTCCPPAPRGDTCPTTSRSTGHQRTCTSCAGRAPVSRLEY